MGSNTGDGKDPEFHTVLPDVMSSIDNGLPVIVYPDWNVAVAYGYNKNTDELLITHPFDPKQKLAMPFRQLVSWMLLLGEHSRSLSRYGNFRQALELAACNWDRQVSVSIGAEKNYYYGEPAFKAWIECIEKADEYATNEGDLANLHSISWQNHYNLVDARTSSIQYIKESLGLFDSQSQELLTAATDNYSCMADLLTNDSRLFCEGSVNDWNREVRRKEADVLNMVLEHERKAVKLLADVASRLDDKFPKK